MEYAVITNKDTWSIYSDDDTNAMRLALFFCWRKKEQFQYMMRIDFPRYELHIIKVEH